MNKSIIIALIAGILIGYLLFAFTPLGKRYEFWTGVRGTGYKIDKWTGRIWWCHGYGGCEDVTLSQKVKAQEEKSTEEPVNQQVVNEQEKTDERSPEQVSFDETQALAELIRKGYLSEDNAEITKEEVNKLNEYRGFLDSFKIQNIEIKRELIGVKECTIVSVSILNESNFTAYDFTLMAKYYRDGLLIDSQELEYNDSIGKNLAKSVTFQIPESLDDNNYYTNYGLFQPEYNWDDIVIKIIAAKRIVPLD